MLQSYLELRGSLDDVGLEGERWACSGLGPAFVAAVAVAVAVAVVAAAAAAVGVTTPDAEVVESSPAFGAIRFRCAAVATAKGFPPCLFGADGCVIRWTPGSDPTHQSTLDCGL